MFLTYLFSIRAYILFCLQLVRNEIGGLGPPTKWFRTPNPLCPTYHGFKPRVAQAFCDLRMFVVSLCRRLECLGNPFDTRIKILITDTVYLT